MINEHLGGVECRSPLHSPAWPAAGTRPPDGGHPSALSVRCLRQLPDISVCSRPSAPCAPASARRPRLRCACRCRRPAVAAGLRLPPLAAPSAPVGSRRGPPASACRRLRSPAARAAPAPRPARCAPRCGAGRLAGLRSPRSLARPPLAAGCAALALRCRRAPSGPWAARPGPGPPLRRPFGAALRLPSRLPPGGLRRGCAPLLRPPAPRRRGGWAAAAAALRLRRCSIQSRASLVAIGSADRAHMRAADAPASHPPASLSASA